MPRLLVLPLLLLASPLEAQTPQPADAPLFRLRARVVRQQGKPPGAKSFTFSLGGRAVKASGTGWGEPLAFAAPERAATLKGYPAIYLRGYPVVVKLSVGGVIDPTEVEAELTFDEGGPPVKLAGELFGPTLGILLWREAGRPRADTMAGYNRRYWQALEGVNLTPAQRPRHFPIVDRFIGGDDDRRDWREGIEGLARAGFSALMLPPSRPIRDLLVSAGLRRTSWAVYSPPGYAFAFTDKASGELSAWAEKQAKPYRDAGYDAKDMALFALSDEPGWYYPQALETLRDSAEAMRRFHAYLRVQKLTPADLGARAWDDVRPLGRSGATDLPSRRRFYWTMRFFADDSSRYFADATRALERAFWPGMPVFTNWNFFAGRLYVPGPVANNRDKTSPDAAMGGHDWTEFARRRGGTMLWTEDWFADAKAYQWSYYAARLRTAARAGGVEFGGYVIPRTAGDRDEGIVQKVLAVVGSGGKAVKYFVFGPEYNFPGNCYSERARVLPQMAVAHRLIGAGEELLWPGRPPRPRVALIHPRSAQLWDAREQRVARGLSDATNHDLNAATVDYLAELYDLYLALQHANIPADILDEDDLTAGGLAPYRAVYLTAPDLPAEGQEALAGWLRGGGTLVTVAGAGRFDRYHEPCAVLAEATGLREGPRERLLVPSAAGLKEVGRLKLDGAEVLAFGARSTIEAGEKEVLDRFTDGTAAVVTRAVGRGRVVHFHWLPGLSYWRSATGVSDRLPAGFSAALRERITRPVRLAGVEQTVEADRPLVETPVLLSDKGAAVTLLNWSGAPVERLTLTVRLAFTPRDVVSARGVKLYWHKVDGGATITLPLGTADVLLIRR